MKKPKVLTKCVANNYAGPDERIIEYTFGPDGRGGNVGGLIRFVRTQDGHFVVDLYCHDARVEIRVGKADG